MKLDKIGFYTMNDRRAQESSCRSPLYRCELIITGRCNFKCPYCRGTSGSDVSIEEGTSIIDYWISQGLKNIRFSGGEPTLHPNLLQFVRQAKEGKVERIAISTNGSQEIGFYHDMIGSGVNDFSVSLDACCASTGDIMAGKAGFYDTIIQNVETLSRLTYVTVGVVLTGENENEIGNIIDLAHNLGVSDIRVIPAAQYGRKLKKIKIKDELLDAHPILKYRMKNKRAVRGLTATDSKRCRLVLDDMAVLNGYHYPCIIYLREGGSPIGKLNKSIREDRRAWYCNHNCQDDPICRNNCLDVCRDYNNQCKKFYNW